MTGDFTRSTFRAGNHYSKVRAQQGRAVLDAELNEQADITSHVERTTTRDVVGISGAPYHDPTTFLNFKVGVSQSGKDLRIAPGRIHVNGVLCENDTDTLTYLTQPDLPGAALPGTAGAGAAGAGVATRTSVPLVSESEGATITWSPGSIPATISTLVP